MEKKTIELYRKKFDDIRHESDGIEYWYARELMKLLDYVQWRNFDGKHYFDENLNELCLID